MVGCGAGEATGGGELRFVRCEKRARESQWGCVLEGSNAAEVKERPDCDAICQVENINTIQSRRHGQKLPISIFNTLM